jgi:hypothetical protein
MFTIAKDSDTKKLFAEKYMQYDEEFGNRFQVKTFSNISNQISDKETSVETMIGSKKRLETLENRRNYLPFLKPGDKDYRNPECAENFYKEGGLIPGSSNFPHFIKTVSKQSDNFYQTMNLSVRTLNQNKLWKTKVRQESFDFDSLYVKTLNKWDKTVLKDYLKSNENDGKKDNGKNTKNDNKTPVVTKKPVKK